MRVFLLRAGSAGAGGGFKQTKGCGRVGWFTECEREGCFEPEEAVYELVDGELVIVMRDGEEVKDDDPKEGL